MTNEQPGFDRAYGLYLGSAPQKAVLLYSPTVPGRMEHARGRA